MSEIIDAAIKFKEALLGLDAGAMKRMETAYVHSFKKLSIEAMKISDQLANATQDGLDNTAKIKRLKRLEELSEQIVKQMEALGKESAQTVKEAQIQAISLAAKHSEKLVAVSEGIGGEVVPTWNRLNVEAFENVIGFTADGSPLNYKWKQLPYSVVGAVKNTIQTGVAVGWNPRKTAKAIRDLGATELFNALTVCRTETMRAYRTASIENYRANDDIVEGWLWLCAAQTRTCAVCWAMDGTFHPLDEDMVDHPRGRCTMVPVTKGKFAAKAWNNEKKFAKLTPEQQLKVLGKKRYGLWSSGKVSLSDFAGKYSDPVWGDGYRLRKIAAIPLKEEAHKVAGDAINKAMEVFHSTSSDPKNFKEFQDALVAARTALKVQNNLTAGEVKAYQEALDQAEKAFKDKFASMTYADLKALAKEADVEYWQLASKQELLTQFIESDPDILAEVKAGMQAKHANMVLKNSAAAKAAKKAEKEAAKIAEEEAQKAVKNAQILANISNHIDDMTAAFPKSAEDIPAFLEVASKASKAAGDAIAGGVPIDDVVQMTFQVGEMINKHKKWIESQNLATLHQMAKTIGIKNWKWANKEQIVTLLSNTNRLVKAEVAEALAVKNVEKTAVWKASQAAKKAALKSAKAELKEATEEVAQAVEELHQEVAKGATFNSDDVDLVWEHVKSKGFVYESEARVGGAHAKQFYVDADGNKWMFKPSSSEWVARAEEAAYKLGRKINPDAVEVRVIKLDGKIGTIQKWKEAKTGVNLKGIDPTFLSSAEIEQIQKEHVIDWLISNHDGHGGQFITLTDDKLVGIDKGQAWKHFGDDILSINYHPNSVYGETEPIYNTIGKAVKSGQVKINPNAVLPYIERAEQLNPGDISDALLEYAKGRFAGNVGKQEAFLMDVFNRAKNIRSDFEKYYADILRKPGFKFGDIVDAVEETVMTSFARIGAHEVEAIRDAKRLGWQGKAIKIDTTEVEDQSALVFSDNLNGQERLVVRLKLRPEAEDKVLKNLKPIATQEVHVVGQPLAEDVFYSDILAAVKSVNYHLGNIKSVNMSKVNQALGHKAKLQELWENSGDLEVEAMAEKYLKALDDIVESIDSDEPSPIAGGYFLQHKRVKAAVVLDNTATAAEYTVSKTGAKIVARKIEKGGVLSVTDEAQDLGEVFGYSAQKGEQYNVDFGGGVKAMYRPWTDTNLYASSGEVEVIVSDGLSDASLAKALDALKKIGVNSDPASEYDEELMYLVKQANCVNEHKKNAYSAIIEELDAKNASTQERVEALRKYWSKKLKVPDITKTPQYNPKGKYQVGWNGEGEGGYRHQFRFDISEEDLDREMDGYALFHSLHTGNVETFLDSVLGSNGAMISTNEKLRVGVKVGGMSPSSDMSSGGANYFFTRIRKLPTRARNNGLYFKKDMLRRMDAITYGSDNFGRVTGDHASKHRIINIGRWKQLAQSEGSDETIIKGTVTLLDNLEMIAVGTDQERKRILDVFKKYDIKKLPDGRDIEEVVVKR